MTATPRKAITIKDIADRLGVSHPTVSRALNGHPSISEETRARVQAAAAELGYIPNMPAKAMRGEGALSFGLAIPEISNELYSRIAMQFAESCRQIGVRMVLVLTGDDPVREYAEIRALAEARVSGIAVTLTGAPHSATLDLLAQRPTIQIVRRLEALPFPALCLEEKDGCADAVDHLISIGHRCIAYIGTDRRVSSGRDRIDGYLAAHARHGISPPQDCMKLGPPDENFGYHGVTQLLALRERPTALIIATSQLVIGALTALREGGIAVPGQMSVIGYGDANWYVLTDPPLTSVALPVDELVEAAVAELCALVRGSEVIGDPFPTVSPVLKLRGSTSRLACE